MKPVYDRIGEGYTKYRRADPRITGMLQELLGLTAPARIADIGAGTGNYSRAVAEIGYSVIAVEPSASMYRQSVRHHGVHICSGTAEHIPLKNNAVDGILCVLASHHFFSIESAVQEMVRVCPAGPIVWFTVEPRQAEDFWLRDYFPSIWERDLGAFFPLDNVRALLEWYTGREVKVTPWPVPHDLQDCFLAAGWRKPEMYLDPDVRTCISAFALTDPSLIEWGLTRLSDDLRTGVWNDVYGHILDLESIDWGYRFLNVE